MDAFLICLSVVALAEIGDKTQLLALALAARWHKPAPIILGVLLGTLANHAAAGAVGTLLAHLIDARVMNWIVVASFAGVAIWMLVPDRLDAGADAGAAGTLGIVGSTALAFFLAEMGDKTQVATVTLAARFQEFVPVVAGTTLGMMIANVPVVLLGHHFAARLPTRAIHIGAALIFVVLGALSLHTALFAAR